MGNLTVKESGEMVNIISPNVNNITSFKVHFSPKQEGSGDPSPENVREIVGWNGVEGYKCGKNMAHIVGYSAKAINEPYASKTLTNNYGTTINTIEPVNEVIITQSTWDESKDVWHFNNGYFTIIDDNLVFGQRYKISFKVTNIINNPLNCSLSNIRILAPKGSTWNTYTNGDYVYAVFRYLPHATILNRHGVEIRNCGMSFTMSDFMVTAVDNEDYTYEPFQGTTTSIDWTNNIGNIYGGYVDLITGELVQSYYYYQLTGQETFTNSGSNWVVSSIPTTGMQAKQPANGFCSHYLYSPYTKDTIGVMYNERTITFDQRIGDAAYWKNFCMEQYNNGTPVTLVYEIKTPFSVTTLSPTQLSTLKGQNNFWSNADYVEIEYELTETFDIQKAKRKIILNQPHVESTSGTIAKPETDMIGKIKECKIHFMPVQQSDSDPTPDNIIPITGWTGIDMYSTGKNLFNLNVPVGLPSSTVGANTTNRIFTPYTVIKGTSGTNYYNPSSVNSYSISNDILTVNGRSGYGVGFAIKAKPNYTYTISASCDNDYGRVAVLTYSKDGVFKKIAEAVSLIAHPKYTFTTNSNTDMLLLTFYATKDGYNVDVHFSNIQLEIGNTVTNYEPFKGNITSVNWENEVGTIYGGYVDLISGELVQEFKQCKINELSWTYSSDGACFVTSKNTPNDILKNKSLLISYIRSDYYTPIDGYVSASTYTNKQDYSISLYASSDQHRIAIKDSRFTDVSSFLSTMGDTYIWYRLAEPIVTYQLTPQQLTTLRGINNIWSSTNGEVEIKYWKH